MLNPRRNGAPAVLVVIALALLAPSQAFASHDLGIYKKEAHVDLSADEATASVSCDSGDHAVDGMWRVDHADQDDYVQPLDLIAGAVDVLEAYPSSDDTYSFRFEKNATGRVQVKLFVSCLNDSTLGGSHTHSFSTAFSAFSTQSTVVTGTGGLTRTSIAATPCPSGQLLVTPGYNVDPTTILDDTATQTDPSPGMMRLYQSHGASSKVDWTWAFENSALPLNYTATITTTWRCLKVKVPQNGFDKHKLVTRYKSSTFTPDPSTVDEGRLNCGDHYKAILAGFSIPTDPSDVATAASDGTGLIPYASMPAGSKSPAATATVFDNVFFLGMDPRIKQRAYRFVNRDSGAAYNVSLSALCLNYRTT